MFYPPHHQRADRSFRRSTREGGGEEEGEEGRRGEERRGRGGGGRGSKSEPHPSVYQRPDGAAGGIKPVTN